MIRSRPFSPFVTAVFAVLALAAFAGLHAQQADDTFRDFEPAGDFDVQVDGETLDGAEIYFSKKARAVLVLAPDLAEPLLFNYRNQRVETVGFMSLAKRDNGNMDILASADIQPKGQFTAGEDGLRYQGDGQTVALVPRVSLTGPQTAASLQEYDDNYRRGARAYSPNAQLVSRLRSTDDDVRIRVFFNSKCSVCKQMVPRVLSVDRALDGSKIDFDYYGVPDSYDDPEYKRLDLHGVPTGIVYVNGREIGRIVGANWRTPELAISNVLSESDG